MSRVRGDLCDVQTARSFDANGIVSDFPDRLSPASFLDVLHMTFSPKTWTWQTAYNKHVEKAIMITAES
jgi:hypothetical protein